MCAREPVARNAAVMTDAAPVVAAECNAVAPYHVAAAARAAQYKPGAEQYSLDASAPVGADRHLRRLMQRRRELSYQLN